MEKATDFAAWACARAKPESVPEGALIAFPVGTVQPWEYLYGTTGVKCTQAILDNRYECYYSKQGWTLSEYTKVTDGWVKRGVFVCDCEGLLDAFLGVDVTANYCYAAWCTDKGLISEIDRPWVIGEAVFVYNGAKMTHIGWVVGFMPDGEPVIVEERGIRYGCVITRLTKRPWTYHGLVTKKLDYKEDPEMHPIFDRVTSPMSTGEAYRSMQHTLNASGYTDDAGHALDEDGKWGNKSLQAFKKLLSDYTVEPISHDIIITTEPLIVSIDGKEVSPL